MFLIDWFYVHYLEVYLFFNVFPFSDWVFFHLHGSDVLCEYQLITLTVIYVLCSWVPFNTIRYSPFSFRTSPTCCVKHPFALLWEGWLSINWPTSAFRDLLIYIWSVDTFFSCLLFLVYLMFISILPTVSTSQANTPYFFSDMKLSSALNYPAILWVWYLQQILFLPLGILCTSHENNHGLSCTWDFLWELYALGLFQSLSAFFSFLALFFF